MLDDWQYSAGHQQLLESLEHAAPLLCIVAVVGVWFLATKHSNSRKVSFWVAAAELSVALFGWELLRLADRSSSLDLLANVTFTGFGLPAGTLLTGTAIVRAASGDGARYAFLAVLTTALTLYCMFVTALLHMQFTF